MRRIIGPAVPWLYLPRFGHGKGRSPPPTISLPHYSPATQAGLKLIPRPPPSVVVLDRHFPGPGRFH